MGKKIRVGVAGYGTIGQRLADGVAMQGDMELVGIADLAPTLSLPALRENDMIGANGVQIQPLSRRRRGQGGVRQPKDIPVAGSFDELCQKVDIMLDSAPGGVGAKNKENYYDDLRREGDLPGRRKELRRGRVLPRLCQL